MIIDAGKLNDLRRKIQHCESLCSLANIELLQEIREAIDQIDDIIDTAKDDDEFYRRYGQRIR